MTLQIAKVSCHIIFKVYPEHLQEKFFIPKIIVPAKQDFTTKSYGRLFQ